MAKNTVWHTEYSAWSLEALVEEMSNTKSATLIGADTFEEVIYHAAEILGVVID